MHTGNPTQKLTSSISRIDICIITLTLFFSIRINVAISQHTPITISAAQAQELGKKIWQNESGCSQEKLTWWGNNENFASLGIGHFIWYPAGEPVTFTQTVPDLFVYLAKQGAPIPDWLAQNPQQPCPWKNRSAFFADFNNPRMIELRTFLAKTIDLQARFIAQRLEHALPSLLATATPTQQKQLETQFYRVAKSPHGLYALIDYLNFKGEGINPKESYDTCGWGLKQVLLAMHGTAAGRKALLEFAQCAKQILTRRVAHAPADKHENQQLPGWKNRIDKYLQ
jgi:hypothetical protein